MNPALFQVISKNCYTVKAHKCDVDTFFVGIIVMPQQKYTVLALKWYLTIDMMILAVSYISL